MRIGVNALYLIPGGVGGTEIYLRNLLPALAGIDSTNRYTLFTNRETGADLVPAAPNFSHAPQGVRASFRPWRILWEQIVLPMRAAHLDVLFNPGFTAPLWRSCPNVTVFHDLQHKRHPENFRRFDLPFWRILLYGAARRSKLLLADSQATRDDLLRFYRLPPEKIRTVPLGVDPAFFELSVGQASRPVTGQPYLLAVSTLHPHKNLDTLLRAFAAFHSDQSGYRLVIAGMRGFFTESLEALRRELGLGGAVEFTGWIPREKLYQLFAHASAFIYPSKFEGFGLPVLEALAAGLPTACSDIEPLAGIVGDAALKFDAQDVSAMSKALARIASDQALRTRLALAGPPRARAFSWEATARATLAVIKEAAQKEPDTIST